MVARKSAKRFKDPKLPYIIDKNDISHLSYPSFLENKTVELIGEGPYSAFMLNELLSRGVDITHYIVKDKPKTKIYNLDVKTFSTSKGLNRVVGNADYSVVFSLGLPIHSNTIDKLNGKFYNIHTSRLSEYRGVADPIKEMVKKKIIHGGVTVHEVDYRIDYGDVLGQKGFIIKQQIKEKRITQKLIDRIYVDSAIPAGANLFRDVLENIESIIPVDQDQFYKRSDLNIVNKEKRPRVSLRL